MYREVIIDNFAKIRALQSAARDFDTDIGVHDANGSIADAKSILGLMSLDYSNPVRIVVNDDEGYILNILLRAIVDEASLESTFKRLNPNSTK